MRVFAWVFALSLALATREASAQRYHITADGTVDGVWIPSGPSVSVGDPSNQGADSRQTSSGSGSFVFMGGGGGLGSVVGSHFLIPLMSFRGFAAVGSYPYRVTSLAGGIALVEPWTASLWEFGIGGFGYRANLRRWTFEALLSTGFSIFVTSVQLVTGATASESNGNVALSPFVRVGASACRRLDPVNRLCVTAAPNVYDFGFMNGGMLSLRWELGS